MMAQEGESGLSPRMRLLIEDMRAQWTQLDRRIAAFDDEMSLNAKEDDAARRLATIPGIGVLNATALVAAIGSGAAFARGRDLASLARIGAKANHYGRKASPGRHYETR